MTRLQPEARSLNLTRSPGDELITKHMSRNPTPSDADERAGTDAMIGQTSHRSAPRHFVRGFVM